MLQLNCHGRSAFLAIREDKRSDSIYFHILMDNLPVVFSCIACNVVLITAWYLTFCIFLRLEHSVAPWCKIFTSQTSQWQMCSPTHPHACSQQCVIFRWKCIWERECMFSKMRFIAMSSQSCSPYRVREPLLFLSLPSSPLFSRANWKTSVIILVLAQIWWDQRWPAGSGRGADGCMLRGTRQRPFRF